MEMSEILDRAKELATRYEANGYIHRDATLLLPNLVAECEFWQQRAIEEHAALKKLGEKVRMRGKALVEERARFEYYVQNENCESWPEARRKYPELEKKYIDIAREQLRQEGKL